MLKYKSLLLIAVLLSVLLAACKEEDPIVVPPEPGHGKISGKAKFLDESPGPFAALELKSRSNGSIIADTCDAEGNFLFTDLTKGEYFITFKSTGPDINSSTVLVTLDTNEDEKVQDVIITYRRLDDFVALQKTNDIFFFKVQADGGRIGNKYDKVAYISGFYRRDWMKRVSLTCEVYKLPEELTPENWTKSELTIDSIRANFEFLMEIFEEPLTGDTREMRIKDANVPILLSDPPNGFVFIKKYADEKELKIPCMDNMNNDYGFIITYK